MRSRALVHAVESALPGAYNVAADGVLALSEIASLLQKPLIPILPPLGLGRAMAALRRLGLPLPVELAEGLRLGRGLDNRRLKATGFTYRYTTREAILQAARSPAAARAAATVARRFRCARRYLLLVRHRARYANGGMALVSPPRGRRRVGGFSAPPLSPPRRRRAPTSSWERSSWSLVMRRRRAGRIRLLRRQPELRPAGARQGRPPVRRRQGPEHQRSDGTQQQARPRRATGHADLAPEPDPGGRDDHHRRGGRPARLDLVADGQDPAAFPDCDRALCPPRPALRNRLHGSAEAPVPRAHRGSTPGDRMQPRCPGRAVDAPEQQGHAGSHRSRRVDLDCGCPAKLGKITARRG